ncbi:hypothetical protein X739_00730 [Mesorhizobium sp. LNHC220B00]|nr:hypothetical protein [Mesorhizobium sp. LNHC220B00]ESY89052.1 hypothetical protein X739_00730 [Mesorhizobium sp. LNHC220B00]
MSESKILDFRSSRRGEKGGRNMSSVATAHELTRDLGEILAPSMPVKVKLDRLYRALQVAFPDVKKFTRRRIRSLFFGEVSRVDHEEVLALEELCAVEGARREHRQFLAYTNRLAAAYAARGKALSREELVVLERIASRSAALAGDTHQGQRRSFRGVAGSRDGGDAR